MPVVRFESFGLNARLLIPPNPMQRIHHHHEVELNFLFRGAVTYLHRGALRRLEAGRLTAFWGSTPHSLVEVEPGSEMAWITVPLAWVWGWGLPGEFVRSLMEGEWLIAPPGTQDRFPVRAWAAELSVRNEATRKRLLLELQACCLWLAERMEITLPVPRPPLRGSVQHVERMARCMAERFAEPLAVAEIARAAGLHPNYAMPLFRRHCGVTIRDYLLQHRLTRAQQLLATTDDKIIDVALASGFGSQSAFYEAFTRILREAPQRYRRRLRA